MLLQEQKTGQKKVSKVIQQKGQSKEDTVKKQNQDELVLEFSNNEQLDEKLEAKQSMKNNEEKQ